MENVLDLMYEKLKENMNRDKKLVDNSVIISLFSVKSNTRLDYLRENSVPRTAFGSKFDELLNCGFIYLAIEDNYALGAAYLLERESEMLLEQNILLRYLEKCMFQNVKANNTLSDKHKVVVLFLLVGRFVDKESLADMSTSDLVKDRWEEVIIDCYDILKKYKLISKLKRADIFGKAGNEHKVYNFIRHTDGVNKSGVPFRSTGKQQYYLDIGSVNDLNEQKLKTTLQKIIGEAKLTYGELVSFGNDINELTRQKAILVNHNSEYLDIEIDIRISEILEELLV